MGSAAASLPFQKDNPEMTVMRPNIRSSAAFRIAKNIRIMPVIR
jgi:hypothetical protein